MAGQRVDLLFQIDQAFGEIGGKTLKLGLVDLDAGLLHVGQHRDQRPLIALVHGRHAFGH